MHPLSFLSGRSPEEPWGCGWPDDSVFLAPTIESDLTPWRPASRGVEGHGQSISACLPCGDIEADTPVDVVSTLSTTARLSRAMSCARSQWADQDAYIPSLFFPPSDEPHTPCVDTSKFPMSDAELLAFFACSTTVDCPNDRSTSLSPLVQDDDDVVFVSGRRIQRRPRQRCRRQRRQRKRGLRRDRSPGRLATSTPRDTKWNHAFLHLGQAGYRQHGASQRSEGDEVFSWNRFTHIWECRHGPDLETTESHDLFDPEFYIIVRPDGDGYPIEVSWDEQEQVFSGIDQMNDKALRLDYDFVWALLSSPDKSRLLHV